MRTTGLALLLAFGVSLASCRQLHQKAHDAISSAGENMGKGGAEFAEGVSQGIDQTTGTIELSPSLKTAGLSLGKFKADSGDSSANDNRLRVYFIFDKDIDRTISVKVFDSRNAEYGRTSITLSGTAGTARNVDIQFDRQTDIERHSRFVIE